MSIENKVLKFLSNKDNYITFKEHALKGVLLTESKALIDYMGDWFNDNPNAVDIDWDQFRIYVRFNKIANNKTETKELIDLRIVEIQKATTDSIIADSLREMAAVADVRLLCQKISVGEKGVSLDDILKTIELYQGIPVVSQDYLVPIDAGVISSAINTSAGLSWRLATLNKGVGPLHKSDFIMIGKRPETGGTSFMISEMVHMLPQLPSGKKAIIFHNEEGGEKVAARVIQSALDVTTVDILSDVNKINTDFKAYKGDHDIEIYHNSDMSTAEIERKLSTGDYALIGFNILEKIKGFNKEEEHRRFAKLARWCRNLAIKYGVVFAIVQADFSAEGQMYLNQSQIFNSKTEVQQETDVLIMIGKSNEAGFEDTRYISVVRNKKPVIAGMDARYKYAKFETWFNHETGIYTEK